ncbi:L,D-transpeptidase family protein [Psychrobacter sp. I-STPA6b]|uniref:L,D-transpeptidase family protein n=1 Tax=Psychrobacter sp. I-STPA6b TaxID=2585718 RepID=UPI001D0C84C1|nr:L,D-transpeptidase family protein [Psychrobacter sp. I-STPA6b]
MLKRNKLSTQLASILCCATLSSVSVATFAASTSSQQTLPVRSVDEIPTLIINDQVVEDADLSDIANNRATANTANQTLNNDRTEELSDDIEEGQAVAPATSNTDESSIASIENNNVQNRNGKVYTTLNLSDYAKQVNDAVWSPNMNVNTAMTVKLQTLLDWNHASPGPIDGGWGMNSKKALSNFQAMHGLQQTGRMNAETWEALTKNIDMNQPVLVEYTLTQDDINTPFATTPTGAEAKSRMKGLYYQNIIEMLGERFHMDVRYLEKLNKGKSFTAGETITVINVGEPLKERITRVVADKDAKTLYAYNGNKLVATYPTTVGSSSTPSPHGTYRIVNKVKMPWYKATVGSDADKKVYMLPPGPNNPVGVVWMGLSKPSYGLHGSPRPEGISRQASHGCIRLTNWDVLEVYANINNGATVELK